MAHIIIFDDADFSGQARLIQDQQAHLGNLDRDNKMSSCVVISGKWQFFQDDNFGFAYSVTLGPGFYPWVEDLGIKNDQVSSLKAVA